MRRLAGSVMAAAAVGAVVIGLMLVGGPGQGRLEQADQRTWEVMMTLSNALDCNESGATAPDALPEPQSTYCGAAFPAIEGAGSVFYEPLDGAGYRICGEFLSGGPLPDWLGGAFDPATGCMTGRVRR